jgi:hypothetical protein
VKRRWVKRRWDWRGGMELLMRGGGGGAWRALLISRTGRPMGSTPHVVPSTVGSCTIVCSPEGSSQMRLKGVTSTMGHPSCS